jgi:hypothetical protein
VGGIGALLPGLFVANGWCPAHKNARRKDQ